MQEKLVEVLFKEENETSFDETGNNKLQPGTMTLKDLYAGGQYVFVNNAAGDQRWISRRNFHIVDLSIKRNGKRRCVVCDIDGVLNYIPKTVDGTTNRQMLELKDRSEAQWTELDKTVNALPRGVNFSLLVHFMEQGMDILFLTARGDTQRIQTERFLREGFKSVGCIDPDYILFMRGFSCNDLSAPDCKAQMMQACILPSYDVEFFIDDCEKNIAAIRDVAPQIPCIHFIP